MHRKDTGLNRWIIGFKNNRNKAGLFYADTTKSPREFKKRRVAHRQKRVKRVRKRRGGEVLKKTLFKFRSV